MKKVIACAGALMLAAPAAHADMLGVYGAIQGWFPDVSGGYGASDYAGEDLNLDRADNITGYIRFEHPVPVIPNFKLRHTNYETSNDGGDAIDVKSMDYTLYYEILDFDIGSLDLGFSVRQFDGDFTFDDGAETLSADVYLPTLYAAVSTELPFTGVSFFGDINYIGYDGSNVSDWEVGIGYKFIDNLAIDMTAQVGYRSTSLELDDIDDVYGKLDYDGVFVGIEAHF